MSLLFIFPTTRSPDDSEVAFLRLQPRDPPGSTAGYSIIKFPAVGTRPGRRGGTGTARLTPLRAV